MSALKGFHIALVVAAVEASAWHTDAVNLSIRKVGYGEGRAHRGHGLGFVWRGDAMLSSSDYLEGVLGGLNLLFL